MSERYIPLKQGFSMRLELQKRQRTAILSRINPDAAKRISGKTKLSRYHYRSSGLRKLKQSDSCCKEPPPAPPKVKPPPGLPLRVREKMT